MLDDAGLKVMELGGKGYCCTQIMILLALDEMGRENPDLVRSAAGLCNGLGDCSGPCGVLSGAAMILGLYSGKGLDMEEAEECLPVMLEELRDWFTETTAEFGGTTCTAILGGECGQPDPIRCGGLLSAAVEQVREILVANELDPTEGRDE
ncbi:DVU_1555 family C-GCAxxG-C-C protein [Pseudodesulfovibrio sediminis]|uniref:C_GCAxxG_C_C family protein n=1 Tax=Pseudodesulfovibrio sediminis TaxID=2810563 RepID=A0ABM7P552_9BACT|nr:DV_1555 family C-GCAxxG-C-C protein [Pseudodesulfovibrio sediminis]BCS88050.1 hypothetical protein PSDVSF_12920 [Pseudodesulfovibrio sediminis]